ncbi:transcription factor ORG2-like [Impatiens glandulifera]|uniref:transcription factor ORG2-like n=1 Tax=Impatiens glandulifera TaxID=253017 RepID=UPI001FB0A489|nr:transcription factor ORG2-like [Impatiens glandulifera]
MTLSPLNPDLFYPITSWPWGVSQDEDPNIYHYLHHNNNVNNNNILPYYPPQTSESSIVFADPPPQQQQQLIINNNNEMKVNSSETGNVTPTSLKAKKLNHNASERDRRKRINDLYSSLRCLLPASDHKKKLSIPATVSRVVKYIPELQKEVEKLIIEKEEITSRICKEKKPSMKKKMSCNYSNVNITVREMGEREITIQILAPADDDDDESEKRRFAQVLQTLEEDVGLILLGVSCFTSGKRLFRNIHLIKVYIFLFF